MSQTVTFREVALRGRKRVPCQSCGKFITRQRKFWQTLNPFNKKPDGELKQASDIHAELRDEQRKWTEEPEKCSGCR